ncbi:hypothetical protein [Photobacterium piscicola]|uniref:Uncharacterized protein n=1 Tax=Photobacterium piscicola TaxID=1378299 RepID=A0ABU6LEB2_9GAMM|nr:hypothetical protein [Photobacterium piscicola]
MTELLFYILGVGTGFLLALTIKLKFFIDDIKSTLKSINNKKKIIFK